MGAQSNMTDATGTVPSRPPRWGDVETPTKRRMSEEPQSFPPRHPDLPVVRQLDLASDWGRSTHSRQPDTGNGAESPRRRKLSREVESEYQSDDDNYSTRQMPTPPQKEDLLRAWQDLPDTAAEHLHKNGIHEPGEILDAACTTTTTFTDDGGTEARHDRWSYQPTATSPKECHTTYHT